MEEELLLNRPTDRRLLDDNNLYPGPPGVENDFESQELDKWDSILVENKKEKSPSSKVSNSRGARRKSKSRSRERKSRSRERGRRSRSRSSERRSRRRFGNRDYTARDKEQVSRVPRNRTSPTSRSNERSRGRDNRDQTRYRRSGRSPSSPKSRSNRWSRSSSPKSNTMPVPPPPPVVSQMMPQQPYPPPPPMIFNDGYNNNYNSGVVGYPQNQQYNNYGDGYSGNTGANNFQQPPYIPPPPVLSQPVPPGDDYNTQQSWTVPPPPIINSVTSQPPPVIPSEEDKIKREAAVALEMQNQRTQLKKQRAEYQKRASALKRELKILKEQRNDLHSGSEPPSPTTKGFIKENDRLQSQIQNKLNTIENVIDMLSGIIGKDVSGSPSPEKIIKSKSPVILDEKKKSPEPEIKKTKEKVKTEFKREKSEDDQTQTEKAEGDKTKVNYVYYDPEMHWCKNCDVFPKTAKDFLNHLHCKEHLDIIRELDEESPWHDTFVSDELHVYPNAPSKRTPIRGLQFFVPATAWYCKLCAIWMGDLRCASLHLKSTIHAEKYNKYVEQNPHFEVDWMADRQKAYEKFRDKAPQITQPLNKNDINFEGIPLQISKNYDSDTSKKKRKESKRSDEKKDKKKKKKGKKKRQDSSSSSSTSSDDSSDTDTEPEDKKKEENLIDKTNSIRVAMRNLLNSKSKEKNEEVGRWTVVKEENTAPFISTFIANQGIKNNDEIISQWATPEPVISETEKKLLEDLKGKLKKKPTTKEEEIIKKDRNYRQRDRTSPRNKDKPRNDRTREYGRDSRDRNYDARGRDYYDRRYDRRRRSRSRSRRKSRSRSPGGHRYRRRYSRSRTRSRSRSRIIEKPIVNYPPEPRIRPEKKKFKSDDDPKKSPKKPLVKPINTGGKKLPFIGRMPVFKKQNTAVESEKDGKQLVLENNEVGQAPPPPSYMISDDGMPHMMMEDDDDDLMPDPAQLMAIMAAAPPPPPIMPMPSHDKNEVVLPPGIDETEADLVPKPISDAPRPRKGPLPKDFQDALNIIFPGEKKAENTVAKEVQEEKSEEPLVVNDIAANVTDEMSQQSMDHIYGPYFMYDHPSADLPLDIGPVPPPPPSSQPIVETESSKDETVNTEEKHSPTPEPITKTIEKVNKKENQAELDDLAMLGIDADDLAAQML